jgi:hypothetical protein
MDDPQRFAVPIGLGMRIGQPAGDTAGDENRQFARQRMLFLGKLTRELLQIAAPNQLHANEVNIIGLAQMVGLDNVRMDQIGDELGLADKILDEHFLAGEIGANDLDGDAFYEIARAMLLGLVDHAHAAFKNFARDVVPEIALDGKESHAWMFGNCALMSSPLL